VRLPAGRPSRRTTALIVSATSLVVLLVVALLLPVPYVRISPGPTFNTIGEHDGTPLIEISGTETFPTTGNLDMVTIQELGGPRGGLTLFQALAGWVNQDDAILPRELLYPDDVSGDQVREENAAAFSTSQSDATAAALNYLERPVEEQTVVTSVVAGSPADGKLDGGDAIVAVDGTSVTEPAQVGELVRAKPIGATVRFDVERDGTPTSVDVVSVANPEDAERPYVGIAVGTLYSAPFDLEFTLEDVGGPSAGTMFALGIVDKLTPGDLAGGRHIAGTGTISPEGAVGPIGGIRQKLAAAADADAELFLMPKVHCEEAAGYTPEALTVVPVSTLTEAVDAIEAWKANRPLPSCP
jgi:Lon-like protease